MITDSPGPPTIQPGIPALQPSIPTSGVASLSIPPMHQTSSSRAIDKPTSPSASSHPPDPAATPLSASILLTSAATAFSAPVSSLSGPDTTTTLIPLLSDLLSQLFSQSSTLTPTSSLSTAPTPSSVISQPLSIVTSPNSWTTSPPATPPAVVGVDPKDALPPSMSSVLVYSLSLPPYSGGLDTSGIAETMTASSPAKDQPSITVYSYNMPPYTPKIPTYVATSAGLAPVSMTTGAPGNPTGNAPTTRVFLQQGSVDPTKDIPAIGTSTIIPLYSPACLGNAYGGGYVITPTMSTPNTNATGAAVVPPAYGFTYKLEPTQSPAYSAAVIVADTKASLPTIAPLPNLSTAVSSGAPMPGDLQPLVSLTGTRTTSVISTSGLPQDLWPASLGSNGPASASGIPSVTSGTAISGVMTLIPTQGAVPYLSLVPAEGTIIAPDTMSSIVSALVDGFRSTSPASLSAPVAISSGMVQNAANTVGTSCTTITTLTTSMLVFTPTASALASIQPQAQVQRAVATFNATGTGSGVVLSTEHLSSELNGTFTLPGNGSDIHAFQGSASSFNVSSMLIVTIVLGLCVLVGANMNFDEWSR
ncbi:MAG: hypothetical protein L6R39_005312 [Caloplaca ligustica]|nr:MAG: hypothetical protein L6R39_005312 [Caloplaca ligustica]